MASRVLDLSDASWRKSSYSNGTGGDCVEVGDGLPGVVPVRDSKDSQGPVVVFSAAGWSSFVTAVKADAYSLSMAVRSMSMA
ncbi:DUF397 domain-containing protein [Streptomyces yunnanensis]|uniref:DUF397 domain-containing protein n=1 Tax=Streptomyces yunnanensis TaxID=156453 RepID=A0A9X8MM51_9ACTN|nr:DUF397 domain-containing protein [Streptomyces yunnanensis]SHL06031.1 protein of unknown function [Streptomyces yunnanensis]